jgi:ADP-ribose pyrophosphatase YjhB (NUDIX family)
MQPFVVLIDNLVEIPPKIQSREAVRAIIISNNQILLMYSKEDMMYGTPGGGITLNESKLDALYRELLEEVGAKQVKIIDQLGQTEEIRESRSMYGAVIKIISDYYYIEVLEFITEHVEDHIEEMGLLPRWVTIDEAILQNETMLKKLNTEKLNFYHTQTETLKYVKNRFGL